MTGIGQREHEPVIGIGSIDGSCKSEKWIRPDGHNRDWMAAWSVLRSGCRWCGTAIWTLYGVGLWCHVDALPQARNFTEMLPLRSTSILTLSPPA